MTTSRPPSPGTPIVIVDDHELIGESLVVALRSRSLAAQRLRVRSAAQIRQALTRGPGGVLLLDLDLGLDQEGRPIDGLHLVGELTASGWRIVIISGSRSHTHVAASIAAGALGYIPKTAPLPDLVQAVVDTVAGRPIMTPTEREHWRELHRRALEAQARRDERIGRLTSREREVLDLLARGQRVATIAERLVVSEATVRTHVKSILRKLEVNSQIEALAIHRSSAGRR